MEFQVVKLNMQAENVVVSHRALIESDLEDQRQEILETIESGQVLEGMVKNITDFGVFIDLGGVDGLLHITDLSWGRRSEERRVGNEWRWRGGSRCRRGRRGMSRSRK